MINYIKSWVIPEPSDRVVTNKQKDLVAQYTQFCKDASSAGLDTWNFGGAWDFNWFKNSGYVRCFDSNNTICYCIPKTNKILFTI